MEMYLLLRWLKWIGLALWILGVLSVVRTPKDSTRIRNLYAFVVPGFALTYMVGWVMMKLLGLSMGSSWIMTSVLLGLISLTATFLGAFSERLHRLWDSISLIGVLTSFVVMISRDVHVTILIGSIFGCLLLGVLGTNFRREPIVVTATEEINIQIKQGFQWVARIEGVTVLVLFLLYIPAKKIFQFNMDGGTGLIGWTHGVYVLIYVLSLTFTARALGWSVKRWFIGGVSSFFPFGTFIFEHRVFKVQEALSETSTTAE